MKISMGITISAGKATAPGADPQQHFWKFRLPFPTNGIAPITQHPPGKAEHPCRAGLPWPGEASSPTSGFRSSPVPQEKATRPLCPMAWRESQ